MLDLLILKLITGMDMDISNTFNWLKDFKPSGNSRLEFLSQDLDDFGLNILRKKEWLNFYILKYLNKNLCSH